MIRDAISRLLGDKGPADADEHKLVSRRASAVSDTPAPALTPPDAEPFTDCFSLGLRDDTNLGWLNLERKEVVPGFALSTGDVVADLGCGEGGIAGFCVKVGARVIMVDSDEEVLAQAVKRAAAQGAGTAEGHVADLLSVPLPDASVSRVICTEVLEHVDEPAAVMKELLRIGQPGALYLISVPGAAAERLLKNVAPPPYFEKPNHVRIFEAADFVKLIEESGLVIEKRMSYGFFWTLYWLFFWQAEIQFGAGSHPLLDAWGKTWHEVLKSKQSDKIRAALHELAPRSIAVVARKPG